MKILIYSPNKSLGQPLLRMLCQHGIITELVGTKDRAEFLAMTSQYNLIVLMEAIGCTGDLVDFSSHLRQEGCSSKWMLLTQNQSLTRISRMRQNGNISCHILPYSYRLILEELYEMQKFNHTPVAQILDSVRFHADLLSRSITCDGTSLVVTPRQFAILCYLIRKPGHLFSKAQIWDEVWGDCDYPINNTIEVHIRRLRMKLPDSTIIETVSGIGYRLRADC